MPISLPASGLPARDDRRWWDGAEEAVGDVLGVVLDVTGDVPPPPEDPCTFGLGGLADGVPAEAQPAAASPLTKRIEVICNTLFTFT
jgi:hypothetical protein